jgi:hypothetical protein
MSKVDLQKLAWMLDADPDVIASQSLDEVRRDVIELGVDLGALEQRISATVAAWLESVSAGTEHRDERPKQLAGTPTITRVTRVAVEPWAATSVAMASPVPPPAEIKLVAKSADLEVLGVEPSHHLTIQHGRAGNMLMLAVEPLMDSQRPDRPLPRRGRLDVKLVRPGDKHPITAALVPRLFERVRLLGYAPAEETEWEVILTIRVASSGP